MLLIRYSGVSTTYEIKGGIKRKFSLSGHIDDPYQTPLGDIQDFGEGDSAFDRKPVRLEIHSSPDPEWLGWLKHIRDTPSISHACGLARVNAGVEPEKFELFGETVEDAAVRVVLAVNADAFEAIQSQAAEAYDHRRILQAKVTLIGDSLPQADTSEVSTLDLWLKPKDLDVSKVQEYGVSDFEISGTRYFDHRRGRVLQVERSGEESYGATISVLLTEARYDVDVEHALFHSISCQGRLINGRGKPYDGVDAAIEFDWFERNRHYELPERAYFGEFSYWVKVPDDEYSSTHFTFHLRHLREDARDFIIPVLTQALENEVILTINLTNGEEELLAVTDKLSGNIRHYNFEVRRRPQTIGDDEGQVVKDDVGKGRVTDEDADTLSEGEAQSLAREWIDNCIPKSKGPFGSSQIRSLMDDLARNCIAESLRNRENKDGLYERLYEAWDIIYSTWRAAAPEYATKQRRNKDDQPDEEEARKIEEAQHLVWKRRDPYLFFSSGRSEYLTEFNVESLHHTIAEYLGRPWLRHPFLDWILIDMLISRELCANGEAIKESLAPRKRERLLDDHHRYFMSKRNPTKRHILGIPVPDSSLKPFLLWDETYEVWSRLGGPVVNPSRVREAMVQSTEHGALWDTPTWSLIDRVVSIDPAAWVIWPSRS